MTKGIGNKSMGESLGNETIEKFIKDHYGLLYSTELLLSIILLVFIIGIMANLSDEMNERILSEEELSSLESIAIETSDYLLNNPGNPENWEDDEGLDNGIASSSIIAGLAIKKRELANGEFYSESESDEDVIVNSISYRKLMKMRNNYDLLVDRNLFNNSFKSSMAIYPLNSKIRSIVIGNSFGDGDDNVNDINIAVAKRTVKCDFYSNLVVYNFNDFELYGEGYERDGLCNHESNPNLESHSNDGSSLWLCKSFRVYRKSLEDYDYYLISDESVRNSNSYWILESLKRTSDTKERLDREVINLDPFFTQDLENSSNEIYSIHFKVPRNRIGEFRTLLAAIPKNMTNDLMADGELKYDYFKPQEVNYVLKIAYE